RLLFQHGCTGLYSVFSAGDTRAYITKLDRAGGSSVIWPDGDLLGYALAPGSETGEALARDGSAYGLCFCDPGTQHQPGAKTHGSLLAGQSRYFAPRAPVGYGGSGGRCS